MNNMQVPKYWKTELSDIQEITESVSFGEKRILGKSAGGRNIYSVFYGRKNVFDRKANLSSALGAGMRECYANKQTDKYTPTLLLAGGIHGAEFEGIAAVLNLISVMESGKDLAGENTELKEKLSGINLLIVPCINPDGRSRVPKSSMVGSSLKDLRKYNQGQWKNGELCLWPECKKYHPIKEYVSFLGGYFNDSGINLMHDDFFINPSEEVKILMKLADDYVPDLTVLLHGGINGDDHILKPAYAPAPVKEEIQKLEKRMLIRLSEEGIRYSETENDRGENSAAAASFNLCSMLYQLCGEACITFESNQGLSEKNAMTYEQIYRAHIILFEECRNFILGKRWKNEAQNEKMPF